jgi:uncharacterized protein HemX
MQDGLNLNLVLNGATLLSVLGLGVKVYLAGKAQKLEQPIEVKSVSDSTPKAQCDERHGIIGGQIENIYGRLKAVETSQAAYEATQEAMQKQLGSIDSKLDTLIKRR